MTNQKGFSLIELLIVILLIALLAFLSSFLVIPSQLAKSRDARRKADIDRIRTALFDYFVDFGCFPKTIPDCHNFDIYPNKEYFSYYRCDPKGLNYIYEPENIDCPSSFEIFTILENKKDVDIDKTNCTNGCGPVCQYNYSVSSGSGPAPHVCIPTVTF